MKAESSLKIESDKEDCSFTGAIMQDFLSKINHEI